MKGRGPAGDGDRPVCGGGTAHLGRGHGIKGNREPNIGLIGDPINLGGGEAVYGDGGRYISGGGGGCGGIG